MSGYTIRHRDEFESMEGSGDATWKLARKALGTSAFGFNLVEIEPGGQIPEHDELASGQVELFIVLDGEATMRRRGASGPGRHLRLDRAARQPHDPQPLRRARHRPADRRQARGRLRADGLGLTVETAFIPA
jgi:hypothetical protein